MTRRVLEGMEQVRPSVQEFALAMERVLRANDNKGGWEHRTPQWLAARAVQEAGELLESLSESSSVADAHSEQEAIDVANMVHMVWYVLKTRRLRSKTIAEYVDRKFGDGGKTRHGEE